MTDWLPSDFSLPALLLRTLGTAAVVVGAGWAAMRLGPLAGGLLAGLPLVMGPGFFFLLRQTPAAVVAQMASHTLLALDQGPGRALALFALLTAAAGVWGVRLRLPRPSSPGPAGWAQLVQRRLLAGAVIGWITTASHWLGPALAGALIGFPVVFSAATLTLHQRQGAASASALLHAALPGAGSLAAFCAALAWALPHWPPYAAFAASVAAAVFVTAALMLARRLLWRR